ncbi:MAG: hypothetical protein WCG79_02290 [Verrucomicrobiota bacterium]|jgi:hypothetical protein
MKTIFGQPSYTLANRQVSAAVTQTGGHLAPVSFRVAGKTIEPFAIAPWWNEKLPADTLPLIRVLRGDFFCLPFGGNATPYRKEKHPGHGETANARWQFESLAHNGNDTTLHLSLRTRVRAGRVDKRITLRAGQTAVYQEHIISGMTGPMNPGHHATLQFPDRPGAGRVSTSACVHRQVYVEPVGVPEQQAYSLLKPGAVFRDLRSVPTNTGAVADLSRYPARRGFEDIAILVADPKLKVAWSAVAFPEEGYVWFTLRDPHMLPATLLWMSNGGRYSAPWNGRHMNVMGVEDVTGFFHTGLAGSAISNALSKRGITTCHKLRPDKPFAVRYIMAVAAIPRRFERVKDIIVAPGNVTLVGEGGVKVSTPLDSAFLKQTVAA